MHKGIRVVSVIFIAALASGLFFYFSSSHEPSYKGKSLSHWVDLCDQDDKESPQQASAAFNAMRAHAIPYLLEQLRWKPNSTIVAMHKQFPKFPFLTSYVQGGSDPRGSAAHALGQFGPLATNAIPQLLTLSTNSDLPSSWYARGCAQAALIRIRQEPLTPYIEKLKDTSDLDRWYQNAMMIGEFGSAATNAIPNLVSALSPTNHEVIQAHAMIALGMIHRLPELCVPAIVPFLHSPSVALRQKAVFALPQFGSAAKPACAELIACLKDPDPWTRQDAGRALKQIDPEAAAKAGIE